MKYYRVKPQYDNMPQNPRKHDGNIFVANELLTDAEYRKLPHKYADAFEIVNIPKNRTYWFFGARFEQTESKWMKGGVNYA